jgi:cytochrome c oxidase assembly protein subunit 15
MSSHANPLKRQVTVLVAITYVLLIVGASVRVHGAGLACPDWPLCFGEVVPPINFHVGLEFGHRVFAGCVSLLFGWVGFRIWRQRDTLSPDVGRWWVGAGVALVMQVILGGLTVLELLAQWTVASHLLVGNLFCALLWVLALRIGEQDRTPPRTPLSRSVRVWSLLLGGLLVAQLVLGGWVSSSHAGLACGNTWPDCAGAGWFPTFEGLLGLHVTHRLVASLLLVTAVVGLFLGRQHPRLTRLFSGMLALLAGQAMLGVANVWLALPVEVTLAHTAGAAASVLLYTTCTYEVWMAPTRTTALKAPQAGEGT